VLPGYFPQVILKPVRQQTATEGPTGKVLSRKTVYFDLQSSRKQKHHLVFLFVSVTLKHLDTLLLRITSFIWQFIWQSVISRGLALVTIKIYIWGIKRKSR
jgi:hypothetical protein